MDQGELAPSIGGNLQQRQRHGLAPGGGGSLCGIGFIQTADDVPHALIDGLPAFVLLDLIPLILLQEQRGRLRRSQHGQFRGKGPGNVVAKLQGVFFPSPVGVTISLALSKNLPETTQIRGNVFQCVALSYLCQKFIIDFLFLQITRVITPSADDSLDLLRFF